MTADLDGGASKGAPKNAAKGGTGGARSAAKQATPDAKGAAKGEPNGAGAPDARSDAPKDAKARFREALERKRAAAHREGEARRNTGSVHGSEVAGSTRRTYRRKTG